MSWLPVLVLVTIVDRNPVSPEQIRRQLNNLVDDVRTALLNPLLQDSYMRETHRRPEDFAWTEQLQCADVFGGNFFANFAGQGRMRWHYGVAHSILAGIEIRFMAEKGRDWLRNEDLALTLMVDGPRNGHFEGLRTFDFRMLWQILGSVVGIVEVMVPSCKNMYPMPNALARADTRFFRGWPRITVNSLHVLTL